MTAATSTTAVVVIPASANTTSYAFPKTGESLNPPGEKKMAAAAATKNKIVDGSVNAYSKCNGDYSDSHIR